jgi:acyl-CoA thioester hydrolase
MKRDIAPKRADYTYFLPIQTRWMDNDVYGHVNNVVYYAYFDTIINRYLIAEGGLDPQGGDVIGLCVESTCRYVAPATYPEELDAGLAVAHLGRTSVRYEIGIWRRGGEPLAFGEFVHVFVARAGRRPVPIPTTLRASLQALMRHEDAGPSRAKPTKR